MTSPPSSSRPSLRILLSAFAFKPGGGSEAGLGWRIASGLAREHSVTVIYGNLRTGPISSKEKEAIDKACREVGNLRANVVEGDTAAKRLAALCRLPGMWWLYYQAYRRWQRSALAKARELNSESQFDATHHLNYIGFREPGELWKLGLPHFWGPLSGSPMVPWSFLRTFRAEQIYRWGGRNVGNWWQMRFSRRCRNAAKASRKIWAVADSDQKMVEMYWGASAETLLETGAEMSAEYRVREYSPGDTLRLIWCGRFDSIKMLPVVLKALDQLSSYSWQLDILGDGPEGPAWRTVANRLSTSKRFHWRGMLPREAALQTMAKSHALVHSSVKEGTPHVVLEALGLGLPVVCHDACGMGAAIDHRCGLKIPLKDPAVSIEGFASALRRLMVEPGLVSRLSAGAGIRASELSWESKIAIISAEYRSTLRNDHSRSSHLL